MWPKQKTMLMDWLTEVYDAEDAPKDILNFYIYGCQIRMFYDKRTTREERVEFINAMAKLRQDLKSADTYSASDSTLDDFIDNALATFFYKDAPMYFSEDILSGGPDGKNNRN